MRRWALILLAAPLFLQWARAADHPVESVATVGETVELPVSRAMTDSDAGPSITLLREPLSIKQRPSFADRADPESARAFDAQNAGDILSRSLAMQVLSQGAVGYPLSARIRGGNTSGVLVLLDGRPLEGAALGSGDLSEIPIEQIDHIEIVRGGLSALYGPNAMDGVVNVISKRASFEGLPISHVGYESASYGRQTYRLSMGSRRGPGDFFIFADQGWESGFRDNSDARHYALGGNGGLSLGKFGKWMLDAGTTHRNAGLPGVRCDILDPNCLGSTPFLESNRFNDKDEKTASTPDARQTRDSTYVRTSYLVSFSSTVDLAARLYGTSREIDFENAADVNAFTVASYDRREHSQGGDLQVTLPYGFLVGGSFVHDREDWNDRLHPSDGFGLWAENWGLFAQQTVAYKPFTLVASGRFDKNSRFGESTNPRVLGILDVTPWLSMSACASRAFRAPTLDEMAPAPSRSYLGNFDLHPEKSWTYEAGFELRGSSTSFRANAYRSRVGDLIQTNVPSDPAEPSSALEAVNVGTARRQGIEIQIHHAARSRLKESLEYSYLDNRGTPFGFSQLVDLAYSPRHTVRCAASLALNSLFTIDSTLRFEDSSFSGNDRGGTKIGSRLLWDMRLAYAWRQLEWYLGVKDITGRRYEEVAGYPLPGRTAYAGLRLRLWG